MDARQRTPGSSDRIEGASPSGLELNNLRQFAPDDALGALQRLVGQVLQGEASERQRHAAAHTVALDVDQFERAAAEIADDTVRLVNTGYDAERG
jgi:hypothetical protein